MQKPKNFEKEKKNPRKRIFVAILEFCASDLRINDEFDFYLCVLVCAKQIVKLIISLVSVTPFTQSSAESISLFRLQFGMRAGFVAKCFKR